MLVDYSDEMTTQSIMGPGLNWRLQSSPTDNHKWECWGYSWQNGGNLMVCRVCYARMVERRGQRWPARQRPCPGAAQGVRR